MLWVTKEKGTRDLVIRRKMTRKAETKFEEIDDELELVSFLDLGFFPASLPIRKLFVSNLGKNAHFNHGNESRKKQIRDETKPQCPR